MDIIDKPFFHIGDSAITLLSIIIFASILLISIIVAAYTRKILIKRILPRHPHINIGVARSYTRITSYLIVITGIITALSFAGINVAVLFAGSAALLVGIGFGIQNIVKNFISGIILLFERPFKEGDFIEVDGTLGTVAAISARSTRIKTNAGVTIIVPNSKFLEEKVVNRSYLQTTEIDIPVTVPYDTDIEKVRKILTALGKEQPLVMEKPEPYISVTEFGDNGIKLKLFVEIKEQKALYTVRNNINLRILEEFRKEGIEMPHPQREIKIIGKDNSLQQSP